MKEKVYEFLEQLKIPYQKFEHPAVFTCRQANLYKSDLDFLDVKNLFLCNKSKSNYYLVILPAEKKTNLKGLQEHLNETRLSFASETDLQTKLGVTAGAVSLFSIINAEQGTVEVLIDNQIIQAKNVGFHSVGFHPNINTETLIFNSSHIPQILNHTKSKWQVLHWEEGINC